MPEHSHLSDDKRQRRDTILHALFGKKNENASLIMAERETQLQHHQYK
jgi:hypothetical protein